MTKKLTPGRKSTLSSIISLASIVLVFFLALGLSADLSELVREGMQISVEVIIPSVFPFLILTDPIRVFTHPEDITPLRQIFERTFKINGRCINAFLLGILCGFPIGAKMALDYYENGIISKDECERLMAISNNPSPAYVISAVGIGLMGSAAEGVILYSSTVLSSVICGILISSKKEKSNNYSFITRQSYSFASSVKSATLACLSLSGFITVFSVLFGLCKMAMQSPLLLSLLGALLEISSGVRYISESNIFSSAASLGLCALSISFSGLCVLMQTLALVKRDHPVSFPRYIKFKLISGLLSFIISIGIYYIFL